jgi:anti-anti-sigma factor
MSISQVSVAEQVGRDAEPLLSVHLASRGHVTVIEVTGELDLSTVHLLAELVDHVARARPASVVLDMAKVSFFCAAGLRVVLNARDTIAAAGGRLVLRAPSPCTWRVLRITATAHRFALDTGSGSGTGTGAGAPAQEAETIDRRGGPRNGAARVKAPPPPPAGVLVSGSGVVVNSGRFLAVRRRDPGWPVNQRGATSTN